MQHTLASLWKPGKGVYIKTVEANLFIFQFYHAIDLNRVIEGSPWSFNRKVLLISRMNDSMNPRCIPLDTLDLWVQVHDVKPGFMSERVMKEVGNQVGRYISSCPSNYKGVWREYMRIRVTIDITKPLRRRMKVRTSGSEWSWITFKYEHVPTFCFICGIIGHADKFCSKLFDTPENEITRPYGAGMRAQLRRQNNLIGSKWLRNGEEPNSESVASGSGGGRIPVPEKVVPTELSAPEISMKDKDSQKSGDGVQQKDTLGGKSGNLNSEEIAGSGKTNTGVKSVILENKKRRTNRDGKESMMPNTEIEQDMENDSMDQDGFNTGPKNGFAAGSDSRARQEL
ncbi:hypothetical protein DCAR_0206909 [Daucus carota subsp. sativus]|uniref:CCHC-type domain-containing protein n=1 Tax=Daucus carota subsp. sativus TaxID=79200 RepID=A0AAF0WG28_DAUCS|nr:hypothetical protein DCAR_0206909 [Daucus carota subsp. sativus]